MEEAERTGATIVLGDRDQRITMNKTFKAKKEGILEDFKVGLPLGESLLRFLDPERRSQALVEERDVILINSLKMRSQGHKVHR
jgi:hypothetical protein